MSAKDIKELAGMAVIQCKEKLVSLIKEFGDIEDLDIMVTIYSDTYSEPVYVVAIKDNKIHYELGSRKVVHTIDIVNLTIDELYKIISHL